MYWYFIVLKKCKDLHNKPDEYYYRRVLELISNKALLSSFTFEYDTKDILHCNYVFKSSLKVNFNFLKFDGCHIHIEKISNKEEMFKVMRYIYKDYRLHIFDLRF